MAKRKSNNKVSDNEATGTYGYNTQQKGDWQASLREDNLLNPPKVCVWDYRDWEELPTFWFSDMHIGHHACDMDLVHRNVEYVCDNEIPCFDLGDLIENATKNSVGSGVYEQNEIAQEQIEHAVALYEPIGHLLQGMQPGNHELRSMKDGGVNLTRIMAKMLGVRYMGAGAVHYFMVGDQRYVAYSHHGGSGATTAGGKINSLLKMEHILPEADLYVQGHTHDCIHHAREAFRFDRKDRTIPKQVKHFVNNGAYLNYWNTYGQTKAFSPGKKGNALITLGGLEHKIDVDFMG